MHCGHLKIVKFTLLERGELYNFHEDLEAKRIRFEGQNLFEVECWSRGVSKRELGLTQPKPSK